MQASRDKKSIIVIDLLRVLSMLWVVGFWHVIDYLPNGAPLRNTATYMTTVACLAIFVLISGYLLGKPSAGDTRSFYLRRFGRVYPPFVGASIAFLIMRVDAPAPILKGAALIGILWGPLPHTLWFMVMICAFYLITPIVLRLRVSNILYFGSVVLTTVATAAISLRNAEIDPRLALYWPVYCVGLWIAEKPRFLRSSRFFLLASATLILALSISLLPSLTDKSVELAPFAIATSATILSLALAINAYLPQSQIIGWIASASFFVYLTHRLVYALALRCIHVNNTAVVFITITGITLPLLTIICYFAQRYYNQVWGRIVSER